MASRDRLSTKKKKPEILRKLLTETLEKGTHSHHTKMESQDQNIPSVQRNIQFGENDFKTPPKLQRRPSFPPEQVSNVSPKINYFILLLLYE
jgi:hypothetical protein